MWVRLTLNWSEAEVTPEELSDILFDKDYWVGFKHNDKYLYTSKEDLPFVQLYLDKFGIRFTDYRILNNLPV